MDRKGFYIKIYSVLILTALIVCGLVYLIVHPDRREASDNKALSSTVPTETVLPSVLPVSTPTVEPTATATSEPAEEIIDVTSDASMQRIVNRNHRVDASYVPSDLTVVNVSSNGQQMLRSEAAAALESMFQAAQNDGIALYLISGYRSYTEQTSLYYTYEERYGRSYADRIDDRPGESEHQLGLAVDLGSGDRSYDLSESFDSTDAYTWLMMHAAEYGFIERYPSGKESITGVAYAPWNFRYIGRDEAGKVSASGLTMEEFYNMQ